MLAGRPDHAHNPPIAEAGLRSPALPESGGGCLLGWVRNPAGWTPARESRGGGQRPGQNGPPQGRLARHRVFRVEPGFCQPVGCGQPLSSQVAVGAAHSGFRHTCLGLTPTHFCASVFSSMKWAPSAPTSQGFWELNALTPVEPAGRHQMDTASTRNELAAVMVTGLCPDGYFTAWIKESVLGWTRAGSILVKPPRR